MSPLYPGGPTPPRERRLVTAVPDPHSGELTGRSAAAARGVSTLLAVFVSEAGGGVLVDVDGNSLIDFGSVDSSARVPAPAAPKLGTADGHLPVSATELRAALRRGLAGRPNSRSALNGGER